MKKTLYSILMLMVVLVAFTSCEKEEIENTATVEMAGDWYVTVDAVDADQHEDAFRRIGENVILHSQVKAGCIVAADASVQETCIRKELLQRPAGRDGIAIENVLHMADFALQTAVVVQQRLAWLIAVVEFLDCVAAFFRE